MRNLIVLTVLAATSPALAQTTTITRAPGQTIIETRPIPTYTPGPAVVYLPRPTEADLQASREREARWLKRCKPYVGAPDPDTGVSRYVYAASGCEFGD